jgi:tRNA threonylcarbamoyladenosine biosynthesis protein TsaB
MNILAFDTCFAACSAAVRWQPSGLEVRSSVKFEPMAAGHAERLIPMIDEVMRESGGTFAELDALAVTEGPGTFTGLRIGLAAARGLALATNLPIRVTTSLHVMAAGAVRKLGAEASGQDLAACAEARNGQVFFQLFSPEAEPLTEAMIAGPTEAIMRTRERPLICVGSGAAAIADAALRAERKAMVRLPNLLPSAVDLAGLASSLPVRQPPVPLYLRAPDAKPQLDKSLPRTP